MLHNYRKLAALGAALLLAGCHTAEKQHSPPAAPAAQAPSAIRVPHLFSDNMILQRGAAVPIWGWGQEGATVTVKFRGQTVSARVKEGKWIAWLHNLKAGGPATLTISAGIPLEFTNVLVGDVWLAGGQSNMEFPLRNSFEAAGDVAAAANPMIRLLRVPHTRLDEPTNDIRASWMECKPETAANISAVAYYFARDLQGKLGVPIGILESDWGGTTAEAWMERGFLKANPDYEIDILEEWPLQQEKYQRSLAAFEAERRQAAENNPATNRTAPRRPWKPAELYNGMIAPLVPFAIKGVLWYQGESNADSPDRATQYRKLFPDLIRDWRSVWGEGDFPFLLVQLAPYMQIQPQPGESAWALLREAQLLATQTLPNVGMAVITDVGEERDIHPKKKKPVGQRLALAARAIAYHEPVEYLGPTPKSMRRVGDEIILTFDHVAGGLEARGGEPKGFAIAGADGKFVWGTAEIQGLDRVAVRSAEVPHPVAVRYGWANYPVVNLCNKAGLPASPFRTDDFPK
ncbi:MAG: sialate O-acetylesterase [Verrucomicrobiota bacterium]|jgi:sialate O-acetylesterase